MDNEKFESSVDDLRRIMESSTVPLGGRTRRLGAPETDTERHERALKAIVEALEALKED